MNNIVQLSEINDLFGRFVLEQTIVQNINDESVGWAVQRADVLGNLGAVLAGVAWDFKDEYLSRIADISELVSPVKRPTLLRILSEVDQMNTLLMHLSGFRDAVVNDNALFWDIFNLPPAVRLVILDNAEIAQSNAESQAILTTLVNDASLFNQLRTMPVFATHVQDSAFARNLIENSDRRASVNVGGSNMTPNVWRVIADNVAFILRIQVHLAPQSFSINRLIGGNFVTNISDSWDTIRTVNRITTWDNPQWQGSHTSQFNGATVEYLTT